MAPPSTPTAAARDGATCARSPTARSRTSCCARCARKACCDERARGSAHGKLVAVRFLAFSPSMALALLAGVAAAIVLAYLLRSQRRRVIVASNLLWRRVAEGARIR